MGDLTALLIYLRIKEERNKVELFICCQFSLSDQTQKNILNNQNKIFMTHYSKLFLQKAILTI